MTLTLTRPRLAAAAGVLAALVLAAVLLWPGDDSTEMVGGTASYAITVEPDADPAVGDNAMTVRVRDKDGGPVAADEVVVEPVMPEMGHTEPAVTATGVGAGDYRATGARLSMAGTWEITVTVRRSGTTESAAFPVLVRD